ncbi:MAG: diguanylate cyclase [Oscillospiraceae bacterium]|nr:diguanylate cyclase [Oscillospiraceae bacterium]
MAKKNTKSSGRGMLVVGAVLLAVVTIFSIILISLYHNRSNGTTTNAEKATQHLHQINDELAMINRNVLMIVSDAGNKEELAKSIDNSFANIEYFKEQYSQVPDRSERELYRYEQAVTFISAYQKKFDSRRNNLDALDIDLYLQEIHPLQTTASEMLNATIDINSEHSQQQLAGLSTLFNLIRVIMVLILIAGEIAIWFASKATDKQNEALRKREAEVEEFKSKLAVSRRKTADVALTNILTGLKNRYALADEYDQKTEAGPFNAAVFNIDNMRAFNESFGYNIGDEFLNVVTETIREKVGNRADIYSYTGDGFCLIFDSAETDGSAYELAEEVFGIFGKDYSIGNLMVNQTATGVFIHVFPSEAGNSDEFLMKTDAILRNAKNQGGNRLVRA